MGAHGGCYASPRAGRGGELQDLREDRHAQSAQVHAQVHVSYAHEEAAGAATLSTGTVSAVCLRHFRQLQPHEPVAPSFFTGSAAPLRALLLARTSKHAVFGLSFHFSRVICSRTKKSKKKKGRLSARESRFFG